MSLCTVTILPERRKLQVEQGSNLLQACFTNGIAIDSPCGGRGTCGKCEVVIEGETILACEVTVENDICVSIPDGSRLQMQQILLDRPSSGSIEAQRWQLERHNPICKRVHLRLNRPCLDECMDDLHRLRSALSKDHGHDALISHSALQKLPDTLREGDFQLTLDLVYDGRFWTIIDVAPSEAHRPIYGLAVDIGTTTVVVYLIDMTTGKEIGKKGRYNMQSVFGSDLISRMIYAEERGEVGLNEMQASVLKSINTLIQNLLEEHGLERTDVKAAVFAGNTVMTHFLMGVSPKYLRLEPYVPVAIEFPSVSARQLGILAHPDALILTIPNVASYVGGDICAGVLAIGLHESRNEIELFIDIGTNGELVLGNGEWMITCACSAGPAFEGSGIACGMRAMDGAINGIEIDSQTLEPSVSTIGQRVPLGICGSGLIDVLAKMHAAGVIDRSGKLNREAHTSRIRFTDDDATYTLVYAQELGNEKEIFISENDIKNLLRAKGAVFAGIRVMLNHAGLSFADISKITIAGGFGSFINVCDAIAIGLLPDIDKEKYSYVGNSSVRGALSVLLDKDKIRECRDLALRMTYLELSIGNQFMDEFVSAMFIPHTNLSLFPNIS